MCSGGGVNHYVSGLMTSMLHENIEEKYLDKIIKIYRVRYITLNIMYFYTSKTISLCEILITNIIAINIIAKMDIRCRCL